MMPAVRRTHRTATRARAGRFECPTPAGANARPPCWSLTTTRQPLMIPQRKIELIAPSGYPHDPSALHLALQRLRAQGHHLENIPATQRRFQRFAGTDSERAAELNRLA